jgi:hypothetical protein
MDQQKNKGTVFLFYRDLSQWSCSKGQENSRKTERWAE